MKLKSNKKCTQLIYMTILILVNELKVERKILKFKGGGIYNVILIP